MCIRDRVYEWKADETGKIVKAKARLVAKGFKQKHGVDYLETFSPIANAASIRLNVALACKYDLELLHFDVEQAFVQSELDYELCMKLPPGCGSMSGRLSVWARVCTDFGRHLERSTKD